MPKNDLVVRLRGENKQLLKCLRESEQQIKSLRRNVQISGIVGGSGLDISKTLGIDFKKISETISKIGKGKAGLLGLVTAVAGVGVVIAKDSIPRLIEFEDYLHNLSAITGVSGQQLEQFRNKIYNTGKDTGVAAKTISESYTLVGSKMPELLKNVNALDKMTRAIITLKRAARMDLGEATEALTSIMNQMGASANEADKYINVLAAGSKNGAGNIQYLATAFEKSGTTIKAAGLSIEQGTALIEILAKKIPDASTAGTNLRNILLKLMTASNDINPRIVGLNKAFENLSKKVNDTTYMTKLFGAENVNAAITLIQNANAANELTKAITGTTEAEKQAAIQGDTVGASFDRIRGKWNNLVDSFLGSKGTLASVFTTIAKGVESVIDAINNALKSTDEKKQEKYSSQWDNSLNNGYRTRKGLIDASKKDEHRKKIEYQGLLDYLGGVKDNTSDFYKLYHKLEKEYKTELSKAFQKNDTKKIDEIYEEFAGQLIESVRGGLFSKNSLRPEKAFRSDWSTANSKSTKEKYNNFLKFEKAFNEYQERRKTTETYLSRLKEDGITIGSKEDYEDTIARWEKNLAKEKNDKKKKEVEKILEKIKKEYNEKFPAVVEPNTGGDIFTGTNIDKTIQPIKGSIEYLNQEIDKLREKLRKTVADEDTAGELRRQIEEKEYHLKILTTFYEEGGNYVGSLQEFQDDISRLEAMIQVSPNDETARELFDLVKKKKIDLEIKTKLLKGEPLFDEDELNRIALEEDEKRLDDYIQKANEVYNKNRENEIEKFDNALDILDRIESLKSERFDVAVGGLESISSLGHYIDNLSYSFENAENGFQKFLAGLDLIIGGLRAVEGVVRSVNAITEVFSATTATAAATDTAATTAMVSNSAAKTTASANEAIASATASGAKLPFPANIAAIAAAIAAVVAGLKMIGKFANGGIVAGSRMGDMNLARVNGGEMILNGTQQKRLFNLLNGEGNLKTTSISGGEVEFKISGSALKGVLRNYDAKMK